MLCSIDMVNSNEKYYEAVSEYNLKELKRKIDIWDDKCLATMLVIDVLQARLLKRIVASAGIDEDEPQTKKEI